MSFSAQRVQSLFELRRPHSIAIYDTYSDAQRAIDYLADHKFPVKNLAIVGTDLKSVERVTGELSWGRVLFSGALSGLTWGIMMAFMLYLAQPGRGLASALMYGLPIGVLAGAVSNALSYAMGRGGKDFSSMMQTVATHYEILGEAEVAPQARKLLGGGVAVQWRQTPPPPAPNPPVTHGAEQDFSIRQQKPVAPSPDWPAPDWGESAAEVGVPDADSSASASAATPSSAPAPKPSASSLTGDTARK